MNELDEKGRPAWLSALPEPLRAQHKEMVEAIQANGLGKHLSAIEALLRPGIDLLVTRANPADVKGVVSRIGGEPDLPPGQPWPMWKTAPLTFVGQVVITDEVKALDLEGLLPSEGVLSFFAHLASPEYGEYCAVLYFPITKDLVRTAPPGPMFVLKRMGLIQPRGRLTIPPGRAPIISTLDLNIDESDAYHDAVWLALKPSAPYHSLLGWPSAATYHDEQGRCFVAQFDSDDTIDLEMGDVETLRIYIDGDVVNASTVQTAASTFSEA
ncbi:DUF1963 domain-containing protein [Sorangium sp. So ce185]|uniref:DUF1963 domain-containing protein n=1 Tax=Sorangium sp. So ce185 TaxID=3133287 RepID=UPI003F63AB67